MTAEEKHDLVEIATTDQWLASKRLKIYLATIEPTEENKGKRTGSQNRSLHLWFQMVADALNDAGFDIQMVIKQSIGLSWTGDLFKEIIWRKVQKPLLKTASTKDLSKTKQIDYVRDHIVRFLSNEPFCLEVPDFPHDPKKNNIKLNAVENLKNENYPEYDPEKHKPKV